MAENYEISIDELPDFEETLTQEDVAAASGGSAPVGKLIVNCYKITGKRMDFMKPACTGLTLHFKVVRAIEVDGNFLEKEAGEAYAGRLCNDDICMPAAGEPDWRKNRRVSIGKTLGLIEDNGGKLTKAKWLSLLNQDLIIINEQKMDKDPATKKYTVKTNFTNVKMFGGYEAVPYDSQGNMKPSKAETATPEITVDDV